MQCLDACSGLDRDDGSLCPANGAQISRAAAAIGLQISKIMHPETAAYKRRPGGVGKLGRSVRGKVGAGQMNGVFIYEMLGSVVNSVRGSSHACVI